ncbi:Carbonic anhydrase [Pseudocercospora fuligena]|uniref:Carbonic anhydrase n=1 Tax=Pseudocercospora fuligena TaxID=685502 RepID=A0A8H6R7X9_9PEZI|nr:Carbonic anhydrase [Pseudocercospora fuligena]
MFFAQSIAALAASAAVVSACAPELYKRDGHHPAHVKRHLARNFKRTNLPNPIEDTRGWTFDQSEEWNTLNQDWGYCFNGTQQSPIAITSSWGISKNHKPTFHYPSNLTGSFNIWDFGPQFTLDGRLSHHSMQAGSSHRRRMEVPNIEFEDNGKNESAYFKSWHTHAPAEHTIDGYRPKAELHFVHYDENANPRAVIGFLIDRHADAEPSPFFEALPKHANIFDNQTVSDIEIDLNQAIKEVGGYSNFFTYKGSLTTPPCYEGIRWFVGRDILYVNDAQMQDLLSVSTFSARPVNPIWLHAVNE